MATFERICVVGLGYIGLPTATVLANAGKKVIGVDINPVIVASLNQGQPHFAEPDLARAVKQAVESGNFSASLEIPEAEAFIIAVPTPLHAGNPDLRYVHAAVRAIAPKLKQGDLVVLESTSPVGTTEQIADLLKIVRPDLRIPEQIALAYCPERVLPSRIMQEIYHNDRIIGGLTPRCAAQAVALYQLFAKGECITTNARTAEMCKLTENSFRDVNIAFANELSLICDELEINVWELIALANRHPRVNILQAGAGVGGHCIAVDPWFIVAQSPNSARLIRTAREVNEHKPQWVINKVKAAFADCVIHSQKFAKDVVIACFGLTFKADVGDLRESPALAITSQLAEWHMGRLLVVEPNLAQLPPPLAEKAMLTDLHTALKHADILVLLVDHHEFKALSPEQITQSWVVDTCGVWR